MDLLQSSSEILTKVETSLEQGVLNERQCRNLLRDFSRGLENTQSIIGGSRTNVFDGAKEDLFRVVSKARALIEDCCEKDWLRAAVVQIDNKEAFRELLADVDCCFDTMCDISQCYYPDRTEEILEIRGCTTFFPTSIDEVDEDLLSIDERLARVVKQQSCASRDVELARYLRGRISGIRKAKGRGLGIIVSPDDYPHPEYDDPRVPLGGEGSSVYRTKWLGLESATKVIDISGQSEEYKRSIFKEAGILGGLSHPNIIKLFCCGFSEGRKEFEFIMERGKMSLSKMLKEKGPLSEPIALDIMLQIASGMCYMHDMRVAHRDLKPENVIVNPMADFEGAGKAHVQVKLLDFGISKHEVKNTPEVPTGGGTLGTVGYMAPEVMKNARETSLRAMDPLKADVFSFGMMCSEIVTGTKPFGGECRLGDYRAKIVSGERPNLPNGSSRELKSLIECCWSGNPSERPTFLEICTKLRMLKNTMLKCSSEGRDIKYEECAPWISHVLDPKQWLTNLKDNLHNGLRQCFAFFSLCLWFLLGIGDWGSTTPLVADEENLGSSDQIVNEVSNRGSESRKLVGVEKRVLELERKLQNVGSLGIIGTGGIGKTTLAKALSGHISHKFEATYFVDDLKDGKCRVTLRDKSKKMQERPEIHSLREGQDILERVRKTKKVLIILDGVGSKSQLHELLGVDKFKDDDGSKLIATSRSWKCLEQLVPAHGKVDMALLDADQSRELFCIHAFASNQPCLPYLEDVAERIVSGCGGLPLSLEVMGTHLQGNQRLRVWERTLYRMLRARDDRSGEEKVWETLRISFDDLDEDEKSMFLDISSFFCGDSYPGRISEGELVRIMNDDDRISKQALDNLKDKSLVKVDDDGYVTMHDQLRDMGRMLAETEFGGSRDRELCVATFNDCNQTGSEMIQGLSFTRLKYQKDLNADTKKYPQLRLLMIHSCEDLDFISNLVKQTSKLRCLMIHFSSEDYSSQIQRDKIDRFWENLGRNKLSQMRSLHIDSCRLLEAFPNISWNSLPLTDLYLRNCVHMREVTVTLWNMTCLTALHLVNCPTLKEIPEGLSNLTALETLRFIKCTSLRTISDGFGRLTCLRKLEMWECEELEEFPSGLENLVALEELKLSRCRKLKRFLEGFGSLARLKVLTMQECEELEEFPSGLGNLVALEELNVSLCRKLKRLLEGFGRSTCLRKLWMWECEELEEFPSGLGNLEALEELDLSKCRKLKRFLEGFGRSTCLRKLWMWECEELEEFPSGLENLVALEELNFSNCRKLKGLPEGFGRLSL